MYIPKNLLRFRLAPAIHRQSNALRRATKMLMSVHYGFAILAIGNFYSVQAIGENLNNAFPRIGAYEIAGSHRAKEPEYRQALAKHDIVIMGMWRNWSGTDAVTNEVLSTRDVVIDIKRRAALMGNDRILVGKYTMFMESFSAPSNTASNDKWKWVSVPRKRAARR